MRVACGTAAGYRQSRFDFDDGAKTFIEREAGIEQANRGMGSRIRLWHWEYRWFQPQHKRVATSFSVQEYESSRFNLLDQFDQYHAGE